MVNIEQPPAPMGPQRKRDLLLRTPSCTGFTLEGPLGASRATVIDPHAVEARALTPASPYFLSTSLTSPHADAIQMNVFLQLEPIPHFKSHSLLSSHCTPPPSSLTYQFLFFTVTSTHHPPHCPQSPQTSSISVTRNLLKMQFSSPT